MKNKTRNLNTNFNFIFGNNHQTVKEVFDNSWLVLAMEIHNYNYEMEILKYSMM
jgi:hypothetical protein